MAGFGGQPQPKKRKSKKGDDSDPDEVRRVHGDYSDIGQCLLQARCICLLRSSSACLAATVVLPSCCKSFGQIAGTAPGGVGDAVHRLLGAALRHTRTRARLRLTSHHLMRLSAAAAAAAS
jgi:hypothetical protein